MQTRFPKKAMPREHILIKGRAQAGTHQAPPERVCVGVEVVVLTLLRQVYQKRGQDEAQEADVPGGDQLLKEAPTSQHLASVSPPAPKSTRLVPRRLGLRAPTVGAQLPAAWPAAPSHMAPGSEQTTGVAVFLGVPTPVPCTPGRTVAKDSPAHTCRQVWLCPKQLTDHQARMLESDILPQLP